MCSQPWPNCPGEDWGTARLWEVPAGASSPPHSLCLHWGWSQHVPSRVPLPRTLMLCTTFPRGRIWVFTFFNTKIIISWFWGVDKGTECLFTGVPVCLGQCYTAVTISTGGEVTTVSGAVVRKRLRGLLYLYPVKAVKLVSANTLWLTNTFDWQIPRICGFFLLKAKVHHGCDGIGSAHSDIFSTQATSPCQCLLLPASLCPAPIPNNIDPSWGNATAAKS